MGLIRSGLVAAFVVGLVGCAATPKPELADSMYSEVGQLLVAGQRCASAGYMSTEDASLLTTYTTSHLNTFSFSNERVQQSAMRARMLPVTKDYCVEQAINVATRKRQIQNHNASVEQSRADTQRAIDSRPKQNYCNRIGSQTMCSTY